MKQLQNLKTFEDACKIEGIDPEKVLPDFSMFPEQDRKALEAHAKLFIIARAANRLANDDQEWKPNWNNYDQWKYYPYFEMGGSSGFRFDVCAYWRSDSHVGSRLCFISEDVAEYMGRTFEALYKDYFVL